MAKVEMPQALRDKLEAARTQAKKLEVEAWKSSANLMLLERYQGLQSATNACLGIDREAFLLEPEAWTKLENDLDTLKFGEVKKFQENIKKLVRPIQKDIRAKAKQAEKTIEAQKALHVKMNKELIQNAKPLLSVADVKAQETKSITVVRPLIRTDAYMEELITEALNLMEKGDDKPTSAADQALLGHIAAWKEAGSSWSRRDIPALNIERAMHGRVDVSAKTKDQIASNQWKSLALRVSCTIAAAALIVVAVMAAAVPGVGLPVAIAAGAGAYALTDIAYSEQYVQSNASKPTQDARSELQENYGQAVSDGKSNEDQQSSSSESTADSSDEDKPDYDGTVYRI